MTNKNELLEKVDRMILLLEVLVAQHENERKELIKVANEKSCIPINVFLIVVIALSTLVILTEFRDVKGRIQLDTQGAIIEKGERN